MVTNSLGKEKFHATNGKAPACSQGDLAFSFSVKGGVGGRIFFHFSLVPNVFSCVSFKFPMCSQT
jgi:hypothetical protein